MKIKRLVILVGLLVRAHHAPPSKQKPRLAEIPKVFLGPLPDTHNLGFCSFYVVKDIKKPLVISTSIIWSFFYKKSRKN